MCGWVYLLGKKYLVEHSWHIVFVCVYSWYFRSSSQSNNTHDESVNPPAACMVCEEEFASITFEPCGHQIACLDCGAKMKKCLACMEPIAKKTAAGYSYEFT